VHVRARPGRRRARGARSGDGQATPWRPPPDAPGVSGGARCGTTTPVRANGLFVAGNGASTGKSAVALGLHHQLARRLGRLGVFRPVVADPDGTDPVVDLLRDRAPVDVPYAASLGVAYADVHTNEDEALAEIVARFRALAGRCDGVLAIGSDFADVGAPTELTFNARVAVNLGLPVVGVVSGHGRTPEEVVGAVDLTRAALEAEGCTVATIVANRVLEADVPAVRGLLDGHHAEVIPEIGLLTAPTVQETLAACDAELVAGDAAGLEREALSVLVAAMTLPNVLSRLTDGAAVLTPGDRADVLLGVLLAAAADRLPAVSAVLLTGGMRPPAPVLELMENLPRLPPVALTPYDTYEAATLAGSVLGRLRPDAPRKLETALAAFERCVGGADVLDRAAVSGSPVVTPLMFEYELLDRARGDRKHIVLPEGSDDRVLRAAEVLLRREVVDLTILGDVAQVRGAAARLGLDLDAATLLDPRDPQLAERFAQEYAQRRAHKGVTVDQARDVVTDVSYFGTLMVELGLVDGMVSGAAHTTAHTIRPSFELIRTAPGVSVVSSVMLMCLSDRVLVYGDCAVVPEPSAEELADIAVQSSRTAVRFGVEPRVAMLSYSTGESGSGAGVDRVRAATQLVRERAPELSVEGPIQYDAAVDRGVAATKLPGSEVAGRATVFVFPDLNTGNNTYKAVQRSAGAVVIGPVLQGLNKPVNDLSRGATVHDIVTTVAITAIQAQDQAAR
jgi:phosphate acetyltransferase